MSNQPQLIRELRKLRERQGLVPGKTERAEALLETLGVTPQRLHQRILEELMAMGQSDHARALRNAYAIGWEVPGTLTHRREWFGIENGGRSPETAEAWENRGIDELLARLINHKSSGAPSEAYGILAYYWFDQSWMLYGYQENLWVAGERMDPKPDDRLRFRSFRQPRFMGNTVLYEFFPLGGQLAGALRLELIFPNDAVPAHLVARRAPSIHELMFDGVEVEEAWRLQGDENTAVMFDYFSPEVGEKFAVSYSGL